MGTTTTGGPWLDFLRVSISEFARMDFKKTTCMTMITGTTMIGAASTVRSSAVLAF